MQKLTKTALLSVSLLVVSGGAIAGNVPAIMADYPAINHTLVELLTTIPSLMIVMTILFSHKLARRIGYKQTVQLGLALVFIAGVLPVFTKSFSLLFISRLLFGVGIGLFNPLLYSFSGNLYKGRELSSVIGMQSSFEGIGGMLMTFSVGQLLLIDWRASFFVYALALPILILFTLFVPKISFASQQEKIHVKSDQITRAVWGYVVLLSIVVTIYMSMAVKITSLLLDKGIGDATDGSNLLALVGLGAMIAGIIFGRLVVSLKHWTLPTAFASLALAMFLIAAASDMFTASLAAVIGGLSFRTFIPYLFNAVNQQVAHSEKNTSILLIAFNLGTAFAPVTIALFQRIFPVLENAGLFIGEGIVMFLLAVGAIVFKGKETRSAPEEN